MTPRSRREPETLAVGLRWGAASALVLAVHLGAGALLLRRAMTAPSRETAAPGIAIDLEPVTVPQDEAAPAPALPVGAPEAASAAADPAVPPPAADAAPVPTPPPPVPEPEAAAPPPDPTPPAVEPPAPPPVPEPPASPPPEMAQVAPPPPPPIPPVPVPISPPPPVPTKPERDAVLAPPLPPPARARPKKVPPPVDRKALAEQKRLAEVRAAERAERREAARQASAEHEAAAGARARAGEERQQRAAASAGDVASWRGRLAAHLNRFKRSPPGGGDGTARVSFTVASDGSVSGVRLAVSSGDPSLDEAALSMVERANPVPPPPPGLGARIPLSVPVHFSGS